MMWGQGYFMNGSWIFGGVGIVGVLVVVGVIVLLAIGRSRSNAGPAASAPSGPQTSTPTPRQILDERYARGELTSDEYQERIKNLASGLK